MNNETALLFSQYSTALRGASVKNTVNVTTPTQLSPIVPTLASVNNEDLSIGTLVQTIRNDERKQNLLNDAITAARAVTEVQIHNLRAPLDKVIDDCLLARKNENNSKLEEIIMDYTSYLLAGHSKKTKNLSKPRTGLPPASITADPSKI